MKPTRIQVTIALIAIYFAEVSASHQDTGFTNHKGKSPRFLISKEIETS